MSQTRKSYSHLIYLPPEIPLKDDKFRHQDIRYQEFIDHHLLEILKWEQYSFHTVRGSVQERVNQILKLVN